MISFQADLPHKNNKLLMRLANIGIPAYSHFTVADVQSLFIVLVAPLN